jgi:DNA-binding SARP family transcriptional activator/predicted ATPase
MGNFTRLELSFLGSFAVKLDGKPIHHFVSDKVRALLAYLAVETTHPHPRERLAELFWPERPADIARANLRNAISDLRQGLSTTPSNIPFFDVEKESVHFNFNSDCRLDVTVFEQEITEAESLQTHSEDLPGAMAHYQSAVSLYLGNFLEGFTLKDCPEFDDWCYFVRERLLYKASTALARLAGYHEGRCEYKQAIAYTRRRVELEPWLEAAHFHMMRLLALDGRRAEALEQYRLCCLKLKEELDIQPAAEVTRLYEQIRDGNFASPYKEDPTKLPVYLTPLVGRQQELVEIEARLQDPECHLLTLAGPGGCGKTRLAVEAAVQQAGHFQDGVRFVPLVTVDKVESIPSAIIQALGISSATSGGPWQSLWSYLREKELLLVLDNYEQLLPGGTEILEDLLQEAPRLKLLVTSRERLHSLAEWFFPVDGLELPTSNQAETVRGCSSIQLFSQTAQRQRGHPLSDEELPHAVRICCSVSGMPLAIEIAASWTRALSCTEITAEIERSLAFLQSDARPLQARHRSVQAVFEHTWEMLTEEEQEVFSRLAVFRGGFTRQAAEAVAGASLLTLTALLDKCLVLRRPSGRCELHELLHQFADEKLGQNPANMETARNLHSDYYLALLNGLDFIRGCKAALVQTDEEYANFLAAWEWCLERGRIETAHQAISQLNAYLGSKIRYNENERLFTRFLEIIPPGTHEDIRAECLTQLGGALSTIGRYTPALEYLKMSLEISERLGLHKIKAFALGRKGRLLFRDDYMEGIHCHQECSTFLEQNGELTRLPFHYLWQGILCLSKGLVTQSADCFQKGIAIGRAISDLCMVGLNFDRLGHARVAQGRLDEAEQCFQDAAENLSIAGFPMIDEGYRLGGLARVALRRGKLDEARALIDESLAVWNMLVKQGSELYAPLGMRYFHLCEILEAQGQFQEMKQSALQGLNIFQSYQTEIVLETPLGIGWALYLLSRAETGLLNFQSAQETLQKTIQHFHDERYTDWILFCLDAWGEMLVKEAPTAERKQMALELLTLILDHPRMQEIEFHPAGKGRVDLEQEAVRLAGELLPGQAAQARETGHALHFEEVVEDMIAGRGRYCPYPSIPSSPPIKLLT